MGPDLARWSRLDSWAHRWDPRWKIAGFGLVTLALGIEPPGFRERFDARVELPLAALGLSIALGIVASARLPLREVLPRLRAPLALLLALGVILPFTHDGPRAALGPLTYSPRGLALGVWIALRALTMLLLVFPAFLTAPLETGLKALRHLRVPSPLVQLLYFAWRYAATYSEQMDRVRTAMRARGFEPRLDARTLAVVGNGLGVLLVTSVDRTRRVLDAMRSRGFDGDLETLDTFRTAPRDVVLFGASALVAGAIVLGRCL